MAKRKKKNITLDATGRVKVRFIPAPDTYTRVVRDKKKYRRTDFKNPKTW